VPNGSFSVVVINNKAHRAILQHDYTSKHFIFLIFVIPNKSVYFSIGRLTQSVIQLMDSLLLLGASPKMFVFIM